MDMASRWRTGRALLVSAALAGLASGSGGEGVTYVTEEDTKVSALASQRMEEFCDGVDLTNVDIEAGRVSLRNSVGSENIILDALKEANSSSELSDKFEDKADIRWIGSTVGPIVFAVVLAVLWFFFCWTACPCCKCCRCCAKQRHRPKILKIVILLCVLLLTACMVFSVVMALAGRDHIDEGLTATSCTAARVVNYTLNGNADENFIGMLPMLDKLSEMKGVLADNSTFVSGVFTILDATADVVTSSYLAEQALQLMSDTLALPANMHPPAPVRDPTGALHTCQLCATLAVPLSQLATAVADSSGKAMADVYTEVQTQLGSESRADLRIAFDGGVGPLRDSATMIRDSFKFFLEDDFKDYQDHLIDFVGLWVVVLSLLVLMLAACGCTSAACCTLNEYSTSKQEAGQNPWNNKIAPCACCSWCCGWGYAVVVLFIGGIMVVVSVLIGSVCLPLDELDGQLLGEIMPALGVETSNQDDLDMMKDMIDGCFSLQNSDAAILMDILFTRDNGTKMSMRQQIQSQTTDLMNAKFDMLDVKLASGAKLMEDASLLELLDLIANNPVDNLIIIDPLSLPGTDYEAIVEDSRPLASSLRVGAGSSLACSDFVFQGETIYGISTLEANLLSLNSGGTSTPTTPAAVCTGQVVCDSWPTDCIVSGVNTCEDACDDANLLMDLKAELINAATYRCDIFQDAAGNDCDLKDMAGDADTGYTGDCLTNGGASVTRKQVTCTLAEFKQYVQDWDTRLRNVFTRVDDVLVAKQDAISVNLKNLVAEEITGPVNSIVDGSSCSFLKSAYADLVTGLCFQGARGFRNVALSHSWNGVLTSMLILVTYSIWRHAVDNRNKWAEEAAKVGAADAEGAAANEGKGAVAADPPPLDPLRAGARPAEPAPAEPAEPAEPAGGAPAE
ncbi:unnamed protein product [Prorocentrum cordatum]|uniref:Uncharacterized protein n=1 Tax=Prorocentrum cordatum TaxID=2364126 RepID=A0ABN9XQ11_9DINO|nr:unnamed protein product [Polarella glacialis]